MKNKKKLIVFIVLLFVICVTTVSIYNITKHTTSNIVLNVSSGKVDVTNLDKSTTYSLLGSWGLLP